VETQLQQEQSSLKEAQAALERECSAREEEQGHLQREHAALEKAQATIKLRDEAVTRLSGELVQEGVSYEDLWQDSEEKDVVILEPRQAATTAHATLESEKKQVEGELLFLPFVCWLSLFGIRSQLGLYSFFQVYGRHLGRR
jgi:hypothetical protein